jgi:cytochrome b6-f complex iron-sulfur subunit
MEAQNSNTTLGGVLGRLPPWPRPALNNSVIAAEQAYRKRSGLPVLSEEDIAALRAGQPMPWEREAGSAEQAPAPAPPAAAPSAPPPPAPAAPAQATSGTPSATVAELLKITPKWSRSSVAAEQARRKRTGLPALTDEEVAMLLGETAAPTAAPAAAPASAAPAAAKPATAPAPARPAAAAAAAPPPVARGTEANKYVGTPAVGTSKAAAAGGLATVGPEDTEVDRKRRRLVWSCVVAFLAAWFLAFLRFFLPRTLFEPSTVFKIGYPADFGLGVDTKFQQKYRIWVDRTPDRLFVIYARCTHLGCTPDWKQSENKFKCPCHGSGFDSEGINFEGPAPRPMDRAHVELAPDGQIVVDVSKLYAWPKGQKTEFEEPGAYLPV